MIDTESPEYLAALREAARQLVVAFEAEDARNESDEGTGGTPRGEN